MITEQPTDYDSPGKEVIESFPPGFLLVVCLLLFYLNAIAFSPMTVNLAKLFLDN
ncbi:MAG: hypothetical protein QNJ47_02265 [Nostocaceae cyanobacterium]|nr:hypothetical protein [Nostocaceae cyanobacterium]